MSPLDIGTVLIVLAAAFGVANHFLLKLPSSIGLVVMGLGAALATVGVDALFPGLEIEPTVRRVVLEIDFNAALMEGMLGLLLFAGALHVPLEDLKQQKYVIALTATVGVVISTFLVAGGFWLLAGVPFVIALVFGALIAPTDPVAVLGLLKEVKVPTSLETKIAGESLFNDGVGYVVFLIVVAIAFPVAGGHPPGPLEVAELFLVEAVGGAVLGGVAGWSVFQVMKRIDDYPLEVLLTLALAMGVYGLAGALHMSGPIAAVVAGLLIGHHGVRFGMSNTTRAYVDSFWRLIDEILNAVLFLLIGFEVFAVELESRWLLIGLATIPLVLVSRLCAVSLPITLLSLRRTFTRGAIPILTWGGLRGGISVALVLSLPPSEWKPLLVTAAYAVVLFSIVVQGLTVKAAVRRFVPAE